MAKSPVTVFTCMDERIFPNGIISLNKKYGPCVTIASAGGSLNLTLPSDDPNYISAIRNIRGSIELKFSKKLVIVNHLDCLGHNGGSIHFNFNYEDELSHHSWSLRKARKVAQTIFPEFESIEILFMKWDMEGIVTLIDPNTGYMVK